MELRLASKEEVDNALAVGKTLPLVPIGLDMCSCATEEEMHENFYATLDRGYDPINEYLYKQQGKVCLVGAGPSIETTLDEMEGDICAINSAIGFLLDHGKVPKWAMLWDASPLVANFAVPHPEVTYLVASRCHQSVFERLKDCKVIVWHAAGDHDIIKVMNKPEVIAKQKVEEPLIPGGSAGITRGIFVMTALGYTEVHIFGADSSYSSLGNTHVRGSLVPEKDMMIAIGNSPPQWFRTTPEWAAQVEEYKAIYVMSTQQGIKLEVHGEGMLPTMHRLLVAKRELRGQEQFVKDMAEQLVERDALNQAASKTVTQPLEVSQ